MVFLLDTDELTDNEDIYDNRTKDIDVADIEALTESHLIKSDISKTFVQSLGCSVFFQKTLKQAEQ